MVRNFFIGIYKNEKQLLKAVWSLRKAGFPIHDVFTPYAVHDLDRAMGLRHSRLPIITFVVGFMAMIFALSFQFWSAGVNWPINVGGKPNDSSLAFLPVTFEVTVLVAGLTTAAAFFFRSRLFPGARPVLIDPRVTEDAFVVVIERKDASFDEEKARGVMTESGVMEIREKTVVI